MAKQPQLSAADIAAQAQLQEEVEIQKAFETGITRLQLHGCCCWSYG